jgi:uncharacterized RDD family membrane protein YckC
MPKIILKDGAEFIVDQAILEENILPAQPDEMIQLGKNFFKKSSIEIIHDDEKEKDTDTKDVMDKNIPTFASSGIRILAYIIDLFFVFVYAVIIFVIIGFLGGLTENALLLDIINTSGSEYDFIYTLIYLSYFIFSFVFFGNTLGGYILGIKIVNINGESSSRIKLAFRSIFIGFPFGLGFIKVFFDKNNQAIHDEAFNTVVVNKKSNYKEFLGTNKIKIKKHRSLTLTKRP